MKTPEPKKILVVDDEPAMRKLIQLILSNRGYQVIVAESGNSAIRLFEEFRSDLVITDLVMPAMDGIEVLCTLRALTNLIPIIVISGNTVDQIFFRAPKLLGATDILQKLS